MSDDIILEPYMLPSKASKTIDLFDQPYNVAKDDGISQWAWASTVYDFKDKEFVSEEKLNKKITEYLTKQLLEDMVDRGLLHSIWSEKDSRITYQATEKGLEALENDRKGN